MKACKSHAEIHGIRMTGEHTRRGESMLHCSHYGRNGSSAVGFVETGTERVVIATANPNALVAGRRVRSW